MALSGSSGPRTAQIGIHSSLRLTHLPCIPRRQAEGTLGAGWSLGQPMEQRGACASGLQLWLAAGLYDTLGSSEIKGPGQVLFWRVICGTLSSRTWDLGRWTYGNILSPSWVLTSDSLLLSGRSQQQVVWLLRWRSAHPLAAWPGHCNRSLTASCGCHSNKQFL